MHELEYENLCCCCIFCLKCWSFHFTVLLITSHLLSERYTDVLKKAAALEAANWDDRSPASSSLGKVTIFLAQKITLETWPYAKGYGRSNVHI